MWSLQAEPREPEDLDGQVAEIIGKLTQDFEIWKALSERFAIDLFCGLFMHESNEGLPLSPFERTRISVSGLPVTVSLPMRYAAALNTASKQKKVRGGPAIVLFAI